MLSAQIQALSADGASVDEICQVLKVPSVVVKSALSADKSEAADIDFTDEDLSAARDGIAAVARYGENERNKLQAAIFIYEVRKGLRIPKSKENVLPINQINQLILQSNQDVTRFIQSISTGDGRRNCDPIECEEVPGAGPGDTTVETGPGPEPSVEPTSATVVQGPTGSAEEGFDTSAI